jgi:Flp pilus assembly protein TadD
LRATTRRDLEAAVQHARKAVELAPKQAGYLDTLAEALFQKGDTAGAVAVMKQCRELEPDNDYFRRQLARFDKGDRDAELPDGDDD